MTVFEVLLRNHRELDAAFEAIERTRSFADAESQFRDLATRIIAYLRAERSVFYPRLARASTDNGILAGNELAQVARYQDRIERMIDHLRLGALADETWRAAMRVLRDQVSDLASIEEWTVFPLASLALPMTELCAIADELVMCEPVAIRLSGVTITYDAPSWDTPSFGAPTAPNSAAVVSVTVPPNPATTLPFERPTIPTIDFDPYDLAA